MKKIIILLIIGLQITLHAQYKGGSKDGYSNINKGISPIVQDTLKLNIKYYGGSKDGYSQFNIGKSPIIQDTFQFNALAFGGNYDGYSRFTNGISPIIPDLFKLNLSMAGGSNDGYNSYSYGISSIIPNPNQLNYPKKGGSYDGYIAFNFGKSPIIADSSKLAQLKKGGSLDGYGNKLMNYDLKQPKLSFPKQNSINLETSFVSKWECDAQVDTFQIQVATDVEFANIVKDAFVYNAMQSNLSLQLNTKYSWRVRSLDNGANSIWSDIWNFTTENGEFTSKPQLEYPLNKTGFLPINLMFGWNIVDNADNYIIQLSNNQNFNFIAREIKLNDSSLKVFDLNDGTKYYWRVKAINDLYESDWSDIWSFNTTVGVIEGDVTLIEPIDNSTNLDSTVTFKWTKLANCDQYLVTIYDDNQNSVMSENSDDSTVSITGFTFNKNYKWSIVGLNNADTSSISDIWNFKTKPFPVPDKWKNEFTYTDSAVINIPTDVYCKIKERNLMNGDGIGVFFKRNDSLIISAYGVWNSGNLSVFSYGNNPATIEKDGFNNNENYNFKFWDGQVGKEYKARGIFDPSSDDFFVKDGDSDLDTLYVITTVDQLIVLNAGWNWVSIKVQPEEKDSIQHINESIINNLLIAKNNAGKVYIPSYDINTIGKWDFTQGYQYYLTAKDTLHINGIEIDPENLPINLATGWNFISYIRNSPLNCDDAFASITDNNNLLIAKNLAGQVYIPSYGINTIGSLVIGTACKLYVNNSDVLIYPGN